MKTRVSYLFFFVLFLASGQGKPTDPKNLKSTLMNCQTCKNPTFHGRDFYLPFCSANVSYPNLCEAVCANEETPSKGSCDKCEQKKCNQIFVPVCSSDGKRLFANKCHARCAGVEDFIDCPGLNMVIPGKTPLPPNKELPLRLQTVGDQDLSSEDENL